MRGRLLAASLAAAACASPLAFAGRAEAGAGDLVVVANSGVQAYGETANRRHQPAISDDGRFIAYVTQGGISEAGDPLFLRDMEAPAPVQIVKASQDRQFGGLDSASPALSANGRYLAFASKESSLSDEDDHGYRGYGTQDIYVYDRLDGGFKLVSRRSGAHGVIGTDNSSVPSISDSGRFVAYGSQASNLVSKPLTVGGVFVRDLRSERNTLISGPPWIDFFTLSSFTPYVAGDGRRIAFGREVAPPYPLTDDTISRWLRDRVNQIALSDPGWKHPRIVSRAPGRRGAKADDDCREPKLSEDGRLVVFTSQASNLVRGDDNGVEDVFLRDTATGSTRLVSRVGFHGALGDGDSGRPSISADGRYVAFQSRAANLAGADPDAEPDVFLKDIETGRITPISVGTDGQPSNGVSANPAITADGRFVAFDSTASNLSSDDRADDLSVYRFQALP